MNSPVTNNGIYLLQECLTHLTLTYNLHNFGKTAKYNEKLGFLAQMAFAVDIGTTVSSRARNEVIMSQALYYSIYYY